MKPWEKDWSAPADTGQKPWERDWGAEVSATPSQPSRASQVLQAAFPTATQDRQPREVPMPFYSGMPGGPQLTRTMGSREQAVPAALLDALTLGTRAAGALGGQMGYEGATGGKTGLEALADPETGLARPARDMLQQMMAQRMQEGGLLGKLDMLPLGLGHLGVSMLEDPLAAVGGAAKAAPKSMAQVVNLLRKGAKPITAATDAAGKGLQAVGKDQMYRVIKPLLGTERKAKKPIQDVIFEYDLDKGGRANPRAIFDRSSQKIEQLGSKLKAEIKAGRDMGARIDVDKEIDQVVADFKAKAGDSPDFFANAKDIDAIAADFKARAASAGGGKGSLDLWQGQNFKQYLGNEGAWQHIAKAKGIPIKSEETARSQVAEMIYHRMNDAIDKGAPNGVRDINRQLSELIPVKQAAGHRAIIAGRNNNISLTDVITGTAAAMNPKLWPVYAVNSLSKSGTAASKMYRMGESLRAAKSPAELDFYVRGLQKLGLTSAEIETIRSAKELNDQVLEPLRKVAEKKDQKKEPIAYGNR